MNTNVRRPLIYAYLFLITVVTGYDLFNEYKTIAAIDLIGHLLLEFLILILSVVGILYLLRESLVERGAKEQFLAELHEAKAQLEKASEQLKAGKSDFIKLIHWQFSEWHLSPGEKEIGFFILKGLSFEEIATIRNTSARTVRKQAAMMYAKANLHNRNEFAAWFLEDLL